MKRRNHLMGSGIRLPSLVLLLAGFALVAAACDSTSSDPVDNDTIDPGVTAPVDDTFPLETLPPETLPPETLPPETTEAPETTTSIASDATVPAGIMTVIETIDADGRFSIFVEAVEDAGLNPTFAGAGPITLFAPTDDAFAALPEEDLDALIADPEVFGTVLLAHIVAGNMAADDLAVLTTLKMASGVEQTITADTEAILIGDATLTESDIEASNGTIHVIDSVLVDTSDS